VNNDERSIKSVDIVPVFFLSRMCVIRVLMYVWTMLLLQISVEHRTTSLQVTTKRKRWLQNTFTDCRWEMSRIWHTRDWCV